MATIHDQQKISKTGIVVVVKSPDIDAANEIIEFVKSVMAQSEYLLTDADEFTVTIDQQIERIKSFREHPDKLMIAPTVDGKVVGLIDFSVGNRRKISHQGAFGMTVLPSLQNQGIGRMMLESVLEWASTNPRIETVRLRVHAKNLSALALYEKLGFVKEGAEVRGVRYRSGEYDDVILMRREVKQSAQTV
jgi:RimJ/RimL family protein N-acetyltransferase